MNIKSDTKEKFTVIKIRENQIHANMAGALLKAVADGQDLSGNIILDMSELSSIDPEIADLLVSEQMRSYEKQHSFVICCLRKELEEWLDKGDWLELLNVTPTESEAWDIVQMEEIERELLD
jgi:anti-anti-sigma regulatory factor